MMKELSIEQKARRYDEAIEKAKEYYKEGKTLEYANDIVSDIFSELKESEGERIRKAIIEFFESEDDNTTYSLVPKKDILAWLEKQGESDETKAKMFLINKGYPIDANGIFPMYEEMYNIIREGFEKQGEQNQDEQKCNEVKPIEGEFPYVNPSDNLDGEIDNIWNRLKCNGVFTATKEGFEEVIRHFVNFVMKQSSWSEEDEHGFENCLYAIKETFKEVDNPHRVGTVDWLKSLKERVCCEVNCTTTKGWSEEDRKIIIELIGTFESAVDGGNITFPYRLLKDYIRVLKSCMPQTNWRPSKEQIMALRWILNNIPYCKYKEEISGLLDQIKDL